MSNKHNITEIRNGNSPTIIVINGFLSESDNDISDWLELIDQIYPSQRVLHLSWPSCSLKKLFFLGSESDHVFKKIILEVISNKYKIISSALGIANNWKNAMAKTMETGHWLSDYIDKQQGNFILMGHSLGARVLFHAINQLNRENAISSVYLFGGAISNKTEWTDTYSRHPSMAITNCYSENDWVLKFAYKLGTVFTNQPIGLNPIVNDSKSLIYNVDLSKIVDGHTDYKKKDVGQYIKEKVKVETFGKGSAVTLFENTSLLDRIFFVVKNIMD